VTATGHPTASAGRPGPSRLVPVPDGLDGLRVDVALARLFGLSRTAAAALIDEGDVSVDGSAPSRSDRVRAGSVLEVRLPAAPDADRVAAPEPVAGLRVLYDDADIVVVDKPVGVAAHPSPGWSGSTVIGGLAAMGYRIATSGAAERQGVVHRLDAGTTGVMVVAKSEHAYTVLKRAFKQRTVDKRYSALVQGHPDPSSGTIDAPIDRHPKSRDRMAVRDNGRAALTHWQVLERFAAKDGKKNEKPAASLIECRLETGRTHQIRVHLAHIGHPLLGDPVYGPGFKTKAARLPPAAQEALQGLGRQALHAYLLAVQHPVSGQPLEFRSELPADLVRLHHSLTTR
jgi:23S rRNA pseudouridine1911/1915/1917 synthase